MKASSHTGESDMREDSRGKRGGAAGETTATAARRHRPRVAFAGGCVNAGCGPVGRGSVFQAGARAAPTALRNRRLCKARRCQLAPARAPPEGKVERSAVARPRAPSLHARGPV